jgi:uncharacterized integral membrane protein
MNWPKVIVVIVVVVCGALVVAAILGHKDRTPRRPQ